MSEVHRYQVVTMLSMAGATIGYDPHGPDVVMAADFDRVTAERDAALGREAALREENKKAQKRYEEMTDRAIEFEGAAESAELGCSLALQREAALRKEVHEIKESLAYRGSLLGRVQAERDALQALLTAADERNDNRDSEIFAQVQSALHRSFSLGQIYWQQADSDSTCQQNKSDQTMEIQEQHILNVLRSLGVALKPAEAADASCEFCKGWGFSSNSDGADEGCGACNGTGKEPSDD